MSDQIKAEIAVVLAEHWDMDTGAPGEWECDCGYPLGNGTGDLDARHRVHVAEQIADALTEREQRLTDALRADCDARALRAVEAALDDYVDCTCGHPNADHEDGACPFPGCGCGVPYDESGITTPPAGGHR